MSVIVFEKIVKKSKVRINAPCMGGINPHWGINPHFQFFFFFTIFSKTMTDIKLKFLGLKVDL